MYVPRPAGKLIRRFSSMPFIERGIGLCELTAMFDRIERRRHMDRWNVHTATPTARSCLIPTRRALKVNVRR
jgi:hypothetical protein